MNLSEEIRKYEPQNIDSIQLLEWAERVKEMEERLAQVEDGPGWWREPRPQIDRQSAAAQMDSSGQAMIFGSYPCCDAPSQMAMSDSPGFVRESCPYCGAVVWHWLSRIDPQSWTDDSFLRMTLTLAICARDSFGLERWRLANYAIYDANKTVKERP